MSEKPWWKDLVDRALLKDMLERGFDRMAGQDFEAELSRLASRIERYVALQVIDNTEKALRMARDDIDSAMKTLSEFRQQLSRKRVKDEAEARTESGEATPAPEGEEE